MKIVVLMEDTGRDPAYRSEHGLSIYVETEKHRLLVDTGKTDAFLGNAKRQGIDLAKVDTVVLSHGHYDHGGGIMSFREINPHAVIYMQQSACGGYYHGERYIGIDKRIAGLANIRMLEGDWRIDRELFLFSGITGRKYFAQGNLSLRKREEGKEMPDSFAHEQCLAIMQEGGSLLISGCAHNGILNILDRYQELFSDAPKMVISGFHMMKKGEYSQEEQEAICATARELAGMDTVFYTGHCTGEQAYAWMEPLMGGKLKKIYSGMRIC